MQSIAILLNSYCKYIYYNFCYSKLLSATA